MVITGRHIYLDGMANRVEYAQLLNDASEIKFLTGTQHSSHSGDSKTDENTLVLQIPVKKPDVTVPVIELFLK